MPGHSQFPIVLYTELDAECDPQVTVSVSRLHQGYRCCQLLSTTSRCSRFMTNGNGEHAAVKFF